MQLYMWQADIVGVVHFVMDCFDLLGAAPDDHDDGYSDSNSSSSVLTAVIIHSFAPLRRVLAEPPAARLLADAELMHRHRTCLRMF